MTDQGPCQHDCLLRKTELFGHLSSESWQRMQELVVPNTYRPGDILFYEGNSPLGIYLLCRGRVKIVKNRKTGRQQIVRLVEAPAPLGDRAFIADQPYAGTGEVIGGAQACFLEAKYCADLFKDADLGFAFARRFARELKRAECRETCLAACTLRQRLADYVLEKWQNASSPPPPAEFELPESRGDIAMCLGTTPEALSRALSELRDKRLITVRDRRLRVLKPAQLSRIACHCRSES